MPPRDRIPNSQSAEATKVRTAARYLRELFGKEAASRALQQAYLCERNHHNRHAAQQWLDVYNCVVAHERRARHE